VPRAAVLEEWGQPPARIQAGERELMVYYTSFVELTVRGGTVAAFFCAPRRHTETNFTVTTEWSTNLLPFASVEMVRARGAVTLADLRAKATGAAVAEGVALDIVLREWGAPLWRLAQDGELRLRYPRQIVEIMIRKGIVTSVEGVSRWRLRTLSGMDSDDAMNWRQRLVLAAPPPVILAAPVVAQPCEGTNDSARGTAGFGVRKAPDMIEVMVGIIGTCVTAILCWTVLTSGFLLILLMPTRSYPNPWGYLKAGPRGTVVAVYFLIMLCLLGHAAVLFYYFAIPIRDIVITLRLR
jgi:hypothetical protein